MRFSLGLVFVTLVLAGCAPTVETATEEASRIERESAAVRTVVDSLNTALGVAFRAGRGDQVVVQYTEDAVTMAGPFVLEGRAAIADWVANLASFNVAMQMTASAVTANGPLAVEQGAYVLSAPGAPEAEVGTYLIQWRLVDGHWRRVVQVATTPQPAN